MGEDGVKVIQAGSNVDLADESYQIIGACFAVYKAMGCGFL